MSNKALLSVACAAALALSTDAIYIPGREIPNDGRFYIMNTGFDVHDEEQDVQKKINWDKVVGGISTGLDLYGKAKGVGLFDEEELQRGPKAPKAPKAPKVPKAPKAPKKAKAPKAPVKIPQHKTVVKPSKPQVQRPQQQQNPSQVVPVKKKRRINWKKIGQGLLKAVGIIGKVISVGKTIAGFFDEEEALYWELNAHTATPEQMKAMELRLDNAITVLSSVSEMALNEEMEQFDEVQRLRTNALVTDAIKVVNNAVSIGLLDEEEYSIFCREMFDVCPKKVFDEESIVDIERPWIRHRMAGIDRAPATFDEDEYLPPWVTPTLPTFFDEDSIIDGDQPWKPRRIGGRSGTFEEYVSPLSITPNTYEEDAIYQRKPLLSRKIYKP